jgi:23S rRNA (cytosine1962-C5)-methyltransferase
VVRGNPDATIISEYGVKYKVDVLNGQKTGAFLDQRENRRRLQTYARGARVLDCFCNEGGFALHAAAGGATEVVGYDASESAVARARTNSTLNQLTAVTFEAREAFEALKELVRDRQEFDIVVLDPPSFARSRKTVATALRGYRELHELALRLLRPEGILVTSSCSHHITTDAFYAMVEEAGRRAGRHLRLLESAGAAPDHPVLVSMPETAYLKFAIFAVAS